MLKISDLQSQIALNRDIISEWEGALVNIYENDVCYLKIVISNRNISTPSQERLARAKEDLKDTYKVICSIKKKIKQYAKLQRALKDEIAYRIRYSRVMREVEALTEKAKVEGWEVVIVDDKKYDEMLKGE